MHDCDAHSQGCPSPAVLEVLLFRPAGWQCGGRCHAAGCGPAESTDKAPWTLEQLLSEHPRCQLAVVELRRMVSNADRAARAAAAASQQEELLYLRATALPRRCRPHHMQV